MSAAAEPASAVATVATVVEEARTTTTIDAMTAPLLERPATAAMSTKKRVDALYNVMGAIEVRDARARTRGGGANKTPFCSFRIFFETGRF